MNQTILIGKVLNDHRLATHEFQEATLNALTTAAPEKLRALQRFFEVLNLRMTPYSIEEILRTSATACALLHDELRANPSIFLSVVDAEDSPDCAVGIWASGDDVQVYTIDDHFENVVEEIREALMKAALTKRLAEPEILY